jgi:crotonobetainyl-CoA:carnitine CoA-transferase CaiB-like acyl-CoA transferase
MPGPLDGIRIIDVTQMISGPVATMLLGDQGADVIKIEPPEIGDFVRSYGGKRAGLPPMFATTNRNKRSVVLNLKQPRGLSLLQRLVETADVFVQNFRPGTAERMGIGEAMLRRTRADLIYVSISGFGESGPYAAQPAYDPIIQALSGLASIQSDETGRPRLVRTIVPDKVTGLTAAQAITAALLARERTGTGQHVRLAMLDAMVAFLWPEGMARYTWVDTPDDDTRPARTRDLIFATQDGFITCSAMSDADWRGLTRALGHPEWLDDARFRSVARRERFADERLTLTAEVLATQTSAEWLGRLRTEGVPCAPVLHRHDLLTDPQIAANQLIVESAHPHAGSMRQTRPAARFEKTPADLRRAAPLLGEHTDEVLREIGLAPADIGQLRSEGVIE